MSHLVEIALFIAVMLFLIQLARPANVDPNEIQVWNDDIERRLLYGRPPRDYR
jgi:hypothetical protein